MTKTFINFAECPFQIGDEVECIDSGVKAVVHRIVDEHVFCVSHDGIEFYRTWSHANGGLTLVWRAPPEPPPAEEAACRESQSST